MTAYTASTQRSPAAVNGKVGAPVTNLTSLPLAFAPIPVDPETVEKYKLKSPRKTFETGTHQIADVKEGDTLTTGGVSYRICAVAFWVAPVTYTKILMEAVQ